MCNINYHMVWSVKYRRKILNPEIEEYLKELVQQIAEDKGFTVHLFECGEGDHVHCLKKEFYSIMKRVRCILKKQERQGAYEHDKIHNRF